MLFTLYDVGFLTLEGDKAYFKIKCINNNSDYFLNYES